MCLLGSKSTGNLLKIQSQVHSILTNSEFAVSQPSKSAFSIEIKIPVIRKWLIASLVKFYVITNFLIMNFLHFVYENSNKRPVTILAISYNNYVEHNYYNYVT